MNQQLQQDDKITAATVAKDHTQDKPLAASTEEVAMTTDLAERERANERVFASLRQQARRQQMLSRGLMALYFIGVASYICVTLAGLAGWLPKMSEINVALIVGYAACIAGAGWASDRWKRTMKNLATTTDLRNIAPFVEGLEMPYTASAAQESLLTLLPRLKAEDAPLLQETHRQILCRYLSRHVVRPAQVPLALAIVNAWEKVGDTSANSVMQKLASGSGYGKLDRRVRDAAQVCLSTLQRKMQEDLARQTLLRASSPVALPSDTLLRAAATSPSTTEAHELLRGTEPDKSKSYQGDKDSARMQVG